MASSSETHDNQAHEHTTIITKALEAWEHCDFKDSDLWEAFKEDFDGWTEDDFKLVSNHEIRKVRASLRKRGVWVEKSRTTIAKALFNTLLEEEATPWTEEEVKRCHDNEKFTSNRIDGLFETDFGRSPRTYGPGMSAFKSSPAPPPATGLASPSTSSEPPTATGLAPPSTSSTPSPATELTTPTSPAPPAAIGLASGHSPKVESTLAMATASGHGMELSNLADMDRLRVYFNNIENTLVMKNKDKIISVICRLGHPSYFGKTRYDDTSCTRLTRTHAI